MRVLKSRTFFSTNGFALSPDGRFLAMVVKAVLSVPKMKLWQVFPFGIRRLGESTPSFSLTGTNSIVFQVSMKLSPSHLMANVYSSPISTPAKFMPFIFRRKSWRELFQSLLTTYANLAISSDGQLLAITGGRPTLPWKLAQVRWLAPISHSFALSSRAKQM